MLTNPQIDQRVSSLLHPDQQGMIVEIIDDSIGVRFDAPSEPEPAAEENLYRQLLVDFSVRSGDPDEIQGMDLPLFVHWLFKRSSEFPQQVQEIKDTVISARGQVIDLLRSEIARRLIQEMCNET